MDSPLILEVFAAMRAERALRAFFIPPDNAHNVNICASVILYVAKVDCFATTVSISVSFQATGVGIDVSSGICFAIRLNGL